MNGSRKLHSFLVTLKIGDDVYLFLDKFPDQSIGRQQVAILVINCLLLFLTISLNGISVITIGKSSQLRCKVCYFVILLQSIVDLGVGVLSTPLFIYYLLSPFFEKYELPFFSSSSSNWALASCLVSNSTVSITFERYVGVLHPYDYKIKVTKKRILTYVCASGGVLSSVVLYFLSHFTQIQNLLSGILLVSFIFTGYVYTRIYFVIRKLIRSERMPGWKNDGNQSLKKRVTREIRHAKSCFLTVVCFVVVLLLYSLSNVIFTVGTSDHILYKDWSVALVLSNSSINSVTFF